MRRPPGPVVAAAAAGLMVLAGFTGGTGAGLAGPGGAVAGRGSGILSGPSAALPSASAATAAAATPTPGAVATAAAQQTAQAAAGHTTTGAGAHGTTATAPPVPMGPGVTATTINIGFIIPTGYSSYGAGAAFASPNFGDVQGEAQALVTFINAHGGIAGRQIVPFWQSHDINNDSRTEEEGICKAFTEDDHVFAVVLAAQGYPETRACYAAHQTLILDPTPFLYGSDSFRSLFPYYWSPNYVNYSRVMRALVPQLAQSGYFGGAYTLGVVTYDVDVYHSIVDNDLRPALQAAGITLDTNNVKYIANTDIPTIQRGATTAVAQMQVAGVNRVVFAGLGPYAPLFMSTAEGANFRPRYGVTSYDQPWFDQGWKAMNPTAQLNGAVGIGFAPVQDVADAQYAFPAAGENTCLGIYRAASITFAQRQDSQHALAYCDAILMLQQAAAPVGAPLTVPNWANAALRLGRSFQSSTAFSTSFPGNRMDGGAAYRPIAFTGSCACFQYTGGVTALG